MFFIEQDGWRIFLLVVGCLMTAYEVFGEITEVISSRQKFLQWKTWRENEIRKDMQFCHPKWPEARNYIKLSNLNLSIFCFG